MVSLLVLAHAVLGEIGIIAFLWTFVELLEPTKNRINRVKIVAAIGMLFYILSWFVGGYYYVTIYGPEVKPIIKGGPLPWAHEIVMETKEHVFLFLPFIAILQNFVLKNYDFELIRNKIARVSILLLTGILVLGGLSMIFTGSIISTGVRAALEILK